jgi:hypothetical protein
MLLRWHLAAALCLPAAFCAALAAGCASVEAQPESPSELPPARMSPDSVALEIVFVRLPASDEQAYEQIWSAADEQHFPVEARRSLAANGLRAGIVAQNLPDPLRELLDNAPHTQSQRSEDVATNDVEINRAPRRMQCRNGQRAKILVSKTHGSLPLLVQEQGYVRGHLLDQAQCLLALKPYPQGDGRVKLDITPEVEHGELRTQWVGSEGSLMQRVGRERLVFDRLRLEGKLTPGQVLVISTTREIKGLGEHFFSETAAGATERTLLLVRVAQTQFDDLFAPDQVVAPLATPAE